MTMPPREALVPLLKLAGTAAVMAAAYSFGSKAVVAAAHKQHDRPGAHSAAASKTTTKKTKIDAELKKTSEAATAVAVEQTAVAPQPATAAIPRSSLVVAMLLQDSCLVRSPALISLCVRLGRILTGAGRIIL